METWKDVIGYEGLYQISNTGKVKSMKKVVVIGNARRYHDEKIMSQEITYKLYRRISFCKEGVVKRFLVHRLVAVHFKDNPKNKKWVNHLDRDKSNNNDWNLEWATSRENTHHYRGTIERELPLGVKPNRKKYRATITIDGKEVRLGTFPTIEEASNVYQSALSNITNAL